MMRAKAAEAMNLDPAKYSDPYPGTQESATITNNSTGLSGGAVAAIAAAVGLPATVLAGLMLLKGGSAPVTSAPGPADSNYTVRFYDRDGNPINVPHISTRPTAPQP